MDLPTDTPIASVSLKPLAGWTVKTQTSKLAQPITTDDGTVTEAITKITWTASAGAAIQPGQFQEFEASLGPLPKVDKVVFKALQTYSDGDVVRWIDEPLADGSEPEHPAPVLTLTAGGEAGGAPATAATTASGTGGAVALGVIGIVVAVGALVTALFAYRQAGARR